MSEVLTIASGVRLRDLLAAIQNALLAGDATAATGPMAEAVELCRRLSADGQVLDAALHAELVAAHERCLEASAELRTKYEASRAALSTSRRATVAYGSSRR